MNSSIALTELFKKYKVLISNWIYQKYVFSGRLKTEKDDMFQIAFYYFYISLKKYVLGKGAFYSFCKKLIMDKMCDEYRKFINKSNFLSLEDLSLKEDTEIYLDNSISEEEQLFQEDIEEMYLNDTKTKDTITEKLILRMRLDGYTIKEISKKLEINVEKIKYVYKLKDRDKHNI
jgi:RNA polymerase sigma factor (sigma-70 family)